MCVRACVSCPKEYTLVQHPDAKINIIITIMIKMEWRREELIAQSVIQNPTPSVLIQNQASSPVSHTIAKIIHLIFFCSSLLQ